MNKDARSTKVTVVVPARNEEVAIGPCLDSILAQDWEDLEVIVVDGASTDSTREVVAGFQARDPRVRLLVNERRIIPVALNLALAQASGAWLVRVDAHATIAPGYLRRAVEHLRTGRYGGVGGRKDGVGVTAAGRAIAAAMGSRFGVGGSTYHYGTTTRDVEHVPFGAYPVDLLRSMGGWDESLRVNQDFELDFRLRKAGHRILFDPALRIDWQSRQSVRELFRQYHRYGRGKVSVARLHPTSMRPRHLAAPALVGMLLAAAAVGVRHPRAGVAMVSPYLGVLTAATVTTARSLDREARPHVPLAFLAMHVGWGLGFWQGLITPTRRAGAGAIPGSAPVDDGVLLVGVSDETGQQSDAERDTAKTS